MGQMIQDEDVFCCLIPHENILFINQLSYHMLLFYFDIALFNAPTSFS